MAPIAEVERKESGRMRRIPFGGKEIEYPTGKKVTIHDGIELAFSTERTPLAATLSTKIQLSELVDVLKNAESVRLPQDIHVNVKQVRDGTLVVIPDKAACDILGIFYRHHGEKMTIHPDRNCFNVTCDSHPVLGGSIPVSGFAVFVSE